MFELIFKGQVVLLLNSSGGVKGISLQVMTHEPGDLPQQRPKLSYYDITAEEAKGNPPEWNILFTFRIEVFSVSP